MTTEDLHATAAVLVKTWTEHLTHDLEGQTDDDKGLEAFIDVIETLAPITEITDDVVSDLALLQYLNSGMKMNFASHNVVLDAFAATMQNLNSRLKD